MVNIFTNGFVVDRKQVKKAVEEVISRHRIRGKWEVNINFVTPVEMQSLHDHQPHEVLSFPLEKEIGPDGVMRLGDIVVLGGLPARRQVELITHSCLHLLGIHHK